MAHYRSSRLGEELKKEIYEIIKNDVKDPRVGFVSIISVEVSGDLRHAKVFVSVLDDGEVKQTLDALKKAAGFIRREIANRIQLRYTPELSFVHDESIAYGAKITKLLETYAPEGE